MLHLQGVLIYNISKSFEDNLRIKSSATKFISNDTQSMKKTKVKLRVKDLISLSEDVVEPGGDTVVPSRLDLSIQSIILLFITSVTGEVHVSF